MKASYGYLKGKQIALFDRYSTAQNKKNGTNLSPEAFFNSLPESDRTTFTAVTHALTHTPLTDGEGRRHGTALDLVANVNEIAGERKGERGDFQFRLYVELIPAANQLLRDAREFFRDKDNSVFHKGYPVNWRQGGPVPNLQISMAKSGNLADIDVDYRSSRFPKALVNGHLRASNSDVRAGKNFFGHIRTWIGLIRWWRPLQAKEVLRVEAIEAKRMATGSGETASAAHPTPEELAEGRKVAEEMNNFLTVWLAKQDQQAAVEFLTKHPNACVSIDSDEEDEQLRGEKAKQLFLQMLSLGITATDSGAPLGERIGSIHPWDPELVFIDHPYASLFALRGIQRDDAAEFRCDTSTLAEDPDRYGEYFVTYLAFTCPSCGGLSFLWYKEDGHWQILSFDMLEG
ncbi:MAG: hypothetical protein HY650_11910 [Acidobacteria bacterium]|nr:hypothetical protein [Acidobacteriota bacterium]